MSSYMLLRNPDHAWYPDKPLAAFVTVLWLVGVVGVSFWSVNKRDIGWCGPLTGGGHASYWAARGSPAILTSGYEAVFTRK
jgi:hypothetical protein